MPELPEVETIRQDLKRKIIGHAIKSVTVRRNSLVRNTLSLFTLTLECNEIADIDRRGKLLICKLAKGEYELLIHLKMTGQLIYQWDGNIIAGGHTEPPVNTNLPNKYSRVILEFDNGSRLFMNDMRAFGYMKLVKSDEKEHILSQYGPEPLLQEFTVAYLACILRARKTTVKAVLINQSLIAGIGNIYADESCFRAGIRPSRRASSLNKKEIQKLHQAIRAVLNQAIKERGTTFNNYRDPDGRKGNFVKFLKVYGRAGGPCVKCKRPLLKKRVAGRGTVWCVGCQR